MICIDVWDEVYSHTTKIIYKVAVSCIQFVLPVLLVFTLYVSIYVKLKNRPQVRKYFLSNSANRFYLLITLILMIPYILEHACRKCRKTSKDKCDDKFNCSCFLCLLVTVERFRSFDEIRSSGKL